MTVRSLRPVRADGSRPHNPVRAHSKPSGGEWERDWVDTLGRHGLARYSRVAQIERNRLYRRRRAATSPAEKAAVPVPSQIGMRLLDLIRARFASGARLVAVSWGQLANMVGCAASTIGRQIKVLEAAGLLAHQRRCRRTEAKPEFGTPQWEQDVSVYRLLTPSSMKPALRRAEREEHDRRSAASEERASAQRHAPPQPPTRPPASAIVRAGIGAALTRAAAGARDPVAEALAALRAAVPPHVTRK